VRAVPLVLTAGAVAASLAACSSSPGVGSGEAAAAARSALNVHRLPLGDGKYLTRARSGYVYSCQTRFNGGGAFRNGPWIDEESKTWDLTRKISVRGSVHWPSRFSRAASSSRLRLSGNGLPPHATGVFPVQSSDPAY
jgi:hypothetical protein